MNDLFHYIGGDLSINNTGALTPVDGTVKGQQRILRRLITNPGDGVNPPDYIWHPTYGAGLPRKIGSNADIPAITALIRAQIALEDCVAQDPAPQVQVTAISNGISVYVGYVDATTKSPQILSFDVNQ